MIAKNKPIRSSKLRYISLLCLLFSTLLLIAITSYADNSVRITKMQPTVKLVPKPILSLPFRLMWYLKTESAK
jgi:hypothetical protein